MTIHMKVALHVCKVSSSKHCIFCINCPRRQDDVNKLHLGSICERGGAGCILAERMVAEIAYKIGRAPKYGA